MRHLRSSLVVALCVGVARAQPETTTSAPDGRLTAGGSAGGVHALPFRARRPHAPIQAAVAQRRAERAATRVAAASTANATSGGAGYEASRDLREQRRAAVARVRSPRGVWPALARPPWPGHPGGPSGRNSSTDAIRSDAARDAGQGPGGRRALDAVAFVSCSNVVYYADIKIGAPPQLLQVIGF